MKKNAEFSPDIIHLHHVGGRGGSASISIPSSLKAEMAQVLYEADVSATQHAIENSKDGVIVMPLCIADKRRHLSFNLNYCPYTSSIFPLNQKYADAHHLQDGADFIYEEVMKPHDIKNIESHALDDLVAEGTTPPVDFLSIDTQGAELLVLKGAERSIRETVVAIEVEVNLVDLYLGSSTFSETDKFLRDRGFSLASLSTIPIGRGRVPKKLRGRGSPLQGEATYLLDQQNFSHKELDTSDINRLKNLALISLIAGFTEVTFIIMQRYRDALSNALDPSTKIGKFLLETQEFLLVEEKKSTPELWHNLYSLTDSWDRFKPGQKANNRLSRLLNVPFSDKERTKLISKLRRLVVKLLPQTRFERFLSRHGLKLAADHVRARRSSKI